MYKITSLVIAEASKIKKTGKETPPPADPKSAPHYLEKTIPQQFLIGKEKVKIDGYTTELMVKTYHPDAILVEGTIELSELFTEKTLEIKAKLIKACLASAKKNGAREDMAEEYTIYQISGYSGDPELFLQQSGHEIARLLKAEKMPLDEKEVEYTLSFQFKYNKDDLMIVDWDGAFVFDPSGEFKEDIELLSLANYQLLRYRILDEDLSERMKKISKVVQLDKTKLWGLIPSKEVTEEFKDLIKIRTQSISQFDSLESTMKLKGDWYSARIYGLISKKFRLESWKEAVKEKMDSLEDVYDIAAENLGMSKLQRLELVQIWAFFFLQIGWLTILILEFFYYAK
jgi:hypothetical protein